MAAFRTFPRAAPYRAKAAGALVPSYCADRSNACPACARSNWWIGRHSAECGFCGTTLPFARAAAAMTEPEQRAA